MGIALISTMTISTLINYGFFHPDLKFAHDVVENTIGVYSGVMDNLWTWAKTKNSHLVHHIGDALCILIRKSDSTFLMSFWSFERQN